MTKEEAVYVLNLLKRQDLKINSAATEAIDMAIAALEKQEQSCDTCRHGRFGDRQCDNCGVRYPNHYEAEEEA